MLNCNKHACPQRCHQLHDHSKVQCKKIIEEKCSKGHKVTWKCWQQSGTCAKCQAETARLEKKRERDLKLDIQRQQKEKAYAAKLAELDDEIGREWRLQKDRADEEERNRVLEQRKKDLEAARKNSKIWNLLSNVVPLTNPEKQDTEPSAENKDLSKSSNLSTGKEGSSSNKPPATGGGNTSSVGTSQAMEDWNYQKTHEMASNDHLDAVMGMIGLESVKRQFLDIKTKIDTCIRQQASLKSERFGAALLGNPGTGKTTVARRYAQFLAAVGVLPGSKVIETTGARLAADGVKACDKLIQDIMNEGGGAVFIDEAYQLASGTNVGGGQVLDFLLAEIENLTGKVVFIIAGYRKPMEKFFAHNPGLPSRFPHEFQFEDYEDEELRRIFEYRVKERFGGRMVAEQGLGGLFCRIVARRIGYGRGHEGFGNARAVENSLAKILSRQAKRLALERRSGKGPDDFLLTREDLLGPEPLNALEGNKSWKKLKNLIGLNTVKQSVKALFDSIQYNYERELAEQPLPQFNLNRVFLGSPGTGKTTIAKLYGQILADVGYLSNGEGELTCFMVVVVTN